MHGFIIKHNKTIQSKRSLLLSYQVKQRHTKQTIVNAPYLRESSNISVSSYLLALCHEMEKKRPQKAARLCMVGKKHTSFFTSTINVSRKSQACQQLFAFQKHSQNQPRVYICGHCGNIRGETCLARHKASLIQ